MKKDLVIKFSLYLCSGFKKETNAPGRFPDKKEVEMTKVYVYDAITGKDITPYVTLKVGKGGFFHVFNSLGVDITENIYFVTD